MKKKKVFTKKLEDFIKDESGNISRDKVLKIGLGTISALGILSAFSSEVAARHFSNASADDPYTSPQDGPEHACNHSSHASHNSY